MTQTANSQDPALVLQGVRKGFHSGGRDVVALDDVSASVKRGIVTGLIGPDAAGKTTLMRLVAGLLLPDKGEITALGLDVRRKPLEVQSSLGYMPQRFGLYEDLTVQENLDLYADLQNLPPADRAERYEQLMKLTGLAPFTGRLAGALSGGMKQKLGLACSLVRPKDLLLLDEPTVGVDPLSRRELWEIVYNLVEHQGMTVLLSTAYLDEAERCQEVILMHLGKLLDQGKPGKFTKTMEGRSFMVTAPQMNKRQLQRELGEAEPVLDALILGEGVRVVTKEAKEPTPAELGGRDGELSIEAVPPRFEDSFVAMLREQGQEAATPSQPGEQRCAEACDGPVIEVKDLKRRFGDFMAVDGISFVVEHGEVLGLLGANGAGKSTTFRMLCGLLPPSEGRLKVAGHNLRKAAAKARQRIGYMAQRFSLYANLSVVENLRFFARVYGLNIARRKQRVQWALEEFELAELANATSGQLPLGYKQRLALAAALMHEPEILFLDEPTSGVDPLARREFWRRINSLAEQKVTVLVTTHFMEEAEYCDRVVIMDRGKVLAEGTPEEIKKARRTADDPSPTLEDAFITLIEHNKQMRDKEQAA
ncbi:MAG: ATP-binding cassette domain-containing protein [Desulfarculus sp.]|nr:ATP-binding cassette domain-containing protein [Pseudomonadota bacterium]MBV1717599.1 ATP-binding cassette domain-containing protein [Desulfarculus sp.]MBU4576060.1 ATP-binding cassette domain-containing protein [Pseudomonadota bacterium]MBU4596573.1 ATP-binding cassette domain-containing protein [Pseudomonadota bacterium]MBV1736816.1 ATP-binding cassette domain-containing protein [Desulfarculus sp.]